MSYSDFTKLMTEHGLAVIYTAMVVGLAASGGGYFVGQLGLNSGKTQAQTDAEDKKTALREKRDAEEKTRLAAEVKSLKDDLAERTKERDGLAAELSGAKKSIESKDSEISRLNGTIQRLTARLNPKATRTPPPAPPTSVNPIVTYLYKHGQKCEFELASSLKLAIGFVQSQIELLRTSALIDESTGFNGHCVGLNSSGRKYVESNGLD